VHRHRHQDGHHQHGHDHPSPRARDHVEEREEHQGEDQQGAEIVHQDEGTEQDQQHEHGRHQQPLARKVEAEDAVALVAELHRAPAQRMAQIEDEGELDQLQRLEAREVDERVLGLLRAGTEQRERHEDDHDQRGQHRMEWPRQRHRVARQQQHHRSQHAGKRHAARELETRPEVPVQRVAVAHLQREAERDGGRGRGQDAVRADVDSAAARADEAADQQRGHPAEEVERGFRGRGPHLRRRAQLGAAQLGRLGQGVPDSGVGAQCAERGHDRDPQQLDHQRHDVLRTRRARAGGTRARHRSRREARPGAA
jgi:hypothetical protein